MSHLETWQKVRPKEVVQSIIALMLVGTICFFAIYCTVTGKITIEPDAVIALIERLTLIAVTFYFAVKAVQNGNKGG